MIDQQCAVAYVWRKPAGEVVVIDPREVEVQVRPMELADDVAAVVERCGDGCAVLEAVKSRTPPDPSIP